MNFICDRCNNKVSFWETFKLKRDHVTICNTCGTSLYPIKTKSFNWGFALGFIVVVLPGEIVYRCTDDLVKTFMVGAICAIIAVFSVAYYTYKTTKFKSVL